MTVVLSPRERHERRWWTPQGFKMMDSFIASHWADESFLPLKSPEDVLGLPCVGLSCCGTQEALQAVAAWARQASGTAL